MRRGLAGTVKYQAPAQGMFVVNEMLFLQRHG